MTSSLPWLILLGPLALILVGLLPAADARSRQTARLANLAALLTLAVALAAATAVALTGPFATPVLGFDGGGLGLRLDALSATMLLLVAFVGVTVIRYSRNYMDGDARHGRFVQLMALTVAAVVLLVTAGNLLQLIVAWIATSLGLNRLLLFYGDRRAAQLAARKKFVVSRLGDLCLIGAALLLHRQFGSFDIGAIVAAARTLAETPASIHAAAVLIAFAAMFKSAQFPLHGWLLEVMETPTPVSALLHAGIINAGGFLILRLADVMLLSTPTLQGLAVVGGVTALFGSLVMLTATSVKVSLAWSTVAQMGFMLLQCGLGAFAAALLHIVAHSLYKAHAFLSSGSVIDLLRASWSPSPGGAPHPARLALALGATLAVAAGIGWAFGITIAERPGAFALTAVMLMGLTLLLANAIDERPSLEVIGRATLTAAGVAVLYFALQRGAEWLTAGTLPATQPLRDPFDALLVAIVIAGFGAVTVFQNEIRRASSAFWQATYVHLSNGLYVNTLANRLAIRLWPARAN